MCLIWGSGQESLPVTRTIESSGRAALSSGWHGALGVFLNISELAVTLSIK